MTGTCSVAEREEIAGHLSSCFRCRESVHSTSVRLGIDSSPETETDVPKPRSGGAPADLTASEPGPGPGDEVLGYRLIERLGRGGMGVAFKAQREFEVEPVAIKMLPGALRARPEELKRVRRVFDMIKSLRHPHIATVYQLGEDPTWGPVLIMELVQGITLRAMSLSEGEFGAPMSVERTVAILGPVARALDYAHGAGVVHRDVKPSNIMLREDGSHVRLIDFGLVDEIRKSLVDLSVPLGEVAGTAPYMSPEQWRGHIPSAESDRYALACVAFEMLTGRPPFVAPDAPILRECHIKEPVPTSPELSDAVYRVFWQHAGGRKDKFALAKARTDRFGSCVDFVAALETAASRQGRDPTGRERPPRGKRPAPGDIPVVECPAVPNAFGIDDIVEGQTATARALGVPRQIDCELGLSMSLIPAGTFTFGIGGAPMIDEANLERPRRVKIEEPFYLARWTITHATWKAVMRRWRLRTSPGKALVRLFKRPSGEPSGSEIYTPVADVAHEEVQEFIVRLNVNGAAQMLADRSVELRYRLPTEAEWEFSCRAGTTTPYHFGVDAERLAEYAWYRANARGVPQRTAMLLPNKLSVYDMHGNVWEWCGNGVLRGGSCRSSSHGVTSTARIAATRARRGLTGIRVAASIIPAK